MALQFVLNNLTTKVILHRYLSQITSQLDAYYGII
ncbi:Uncharacterised protein [Segatella oris]|uniref:Uncharacterized protein n=1 Tax=Segatella oris TaxID=28135 RepID=A0A3S4T6Z2_9BACT|nr:Uncharacterised protein [Segatella oris]